MTQVDQSTRTLETQRLQRLQGALGNAQFDALILIQPANVHYASGYRSLGAAVHGIASIAVVVTPDDLHLAGPIADAAPAFDAGSAEDKFAAYGRFYFESEGGHATATRLVDEHADLATAVLTTLGRLGLERASVGIDTDSAPVRAALADHLPNVRVSDASAWMSTLRGIKLPGEVALLEESARVAEDGIIKAVESAHVGTTEQELAAIVATTMAQGGLEPRFVVVTAGERSALGDAFPTDREIQRGDLVRFDVGGTLHGYWSDIGRTAVVGPPSDRQRRFYDAILQGEQDELDLARPGVAANDIFRRAIEVVEANGGPSPYRRHHCGHGIGLTTYEPPIIRPADDDPLQPGMVFCFETPYYELGWGGMMVEDALVITDDGCRMLTGRAREMMEIPA
ncbi:M24 family metallopeptidase [Gordonia sp. DT30]|uniref:M24 family metallopeptidase n=1 Tax=unclassified Gordonia (in: high G+C Gram-positive bacteria) TaxID=2657482 RepID=UPI003CF18D8C